jgi:dihydroxyacetone kinase
VKRSIEAACKALIEAEEELTELDRATGDGDLGTSMRRAAAAVRSRLDSYPLNNVSATLKAVGQDLQREMGGSSGPLYGVLFLRCGSALEGSSTSGLTRWVEAVDQGCHAISELGGAKPGDRTMLDALVPFAKSLKDAGGDPSREILLTAVEAAERGAKATAHMKPRLGRSSYLGDRVLGHVDPGAQAVAIWLRAASEALFPL